MTDLELKEKKIEVMTRFRKDMTEVEVGFLENAVNRLKARNKPILMMHKGKEVSVSIEGIDRVECQVFSSSRPKVKVKVPSGKITAVYIDSLYVKEGNSIIKESLGN